MEENLPIGYYFVGVEEIEKGKETCVSFAGESYAVLSGVNYFSNLVDAANVATEVPERLINGLPKEYESFSAPVILIGEGVHDHTSVALRNSAYIIGDKNAKIVGQFWYGHITIEGKATTIDRLILENVRIEDHRDGVGEYSLTCRNLTYTGANPWWSYYCPVKKKECVKRYTLENITLDGVDGFGYGFEFFCIAPTKLSVKNLRVIHSNKGLGFCLSKPCVSEGAYVDFSFEDCTFLNNSWEQSIEFDFSTAGGQLRFQRCYFEHTLLNCETLFRFKTTKTTTVSFDNCTFLEKEKRFAVVEKDGGAVAVKNCDLQVKRTDEGDIFFDVETEKKDFLDKELYALTDKHEQAETDFSRLENYYVGRTPFYCDMHVHSNSGGTSDGLLNFSEWKKEMKEKNLDFISIADHRQMRHFFLSDFDDEKFFYANEPEAILDGDYACPRLHYNMIFPDKYGLKATLERFPEKYEFQGDELTGSFVYKSFTRKEMEDVAAFVTENGGIFAHAHPKAMLTSNDPLDYYFGEGTYIECFSNVYTAFSAQRNCKLWSDLLLKGKRVYNLSGSDSHGHCKNGCVNVVYAEKRHNTSLFPYFKKGDFSSGAIGIKMMVDDMPMGGIARFCEGKTLSVEIGDLFKIYENKRFLIKIVTDKGTAYSALFDGKETMRVCLQVKKRKFYRVEIIDLDNLCVFGLSNPIWIE